MRRLLTQLHLVAVTLTFAAVTACEDDAVESTDNGDVVDTGTNDAAETDGSDPTDILDTNDQIDAIEDVTTEVDADVVDTTDVEADGSADDVTDELPPPRDRYPDVPEIEPAFDPEGERPTATQCYEEFTGVGEGSDTPNYDEFAPTVGYHCLGTDHQDIEGIEKVVFLGDSVTVGTFPSWEEEFYRNILAEWLTEEFGEIEVDFEQARYGARIDDLLQGPHEQILKAFPDVEEKRTLVIMTMGGNDVAAWAEDHVDGVSDEEIMLEADRAVADFEAAIRWFGEHPERFPNGVFVIFANVYEYTDATGDTLSCEIASAIGLTEPWPGGRAPVVRLNEAMARVAVETGTDMIFMLENFCGHGYRRDDAEGQCYRGPDAELWFDLTCIHPNPAGHYQIARMFWSVINE